MYAASHQGRHVRAPWVGARSASKGFLSTVQALALALSTAFTAPFVAFGEPRVEFDVPRAVECRDVTPQDRLSLYPMQRLIEVALPISVRFHDATIDDIDEIDIEVSGASAGLRVQEFAPMTQLASEITREIETTTTNKKTRTFEGTLGGSLPIPGAEAVAHISPSLTAGASGCNTEVEKTNRLPAKHVVVVSGTTAEGRGVFFKLKRTSQTSLEGVHDVAITFVAPRTWPTVAVHVECSALGQRKTLWIKQDATLGRLDRYVQLMPAAPAAVRQIVLKPTVADASDFADSSAASPTRWRPAQLKPVAVKPSASTELAQKLKIMADAAPADSADASISLDTLDK